MSFGRVGLVIVVRPRTEHAAENGREDNHHRGGSPGDPDPRRPAFPPGLARSERATLAVGFFGAIVGEVGGRAGRVI